MKIKKLKLTNFRCFENFEIAFEATRIVDSQEHGGVTVLVAANGKGKTAIVESIAYALNIFISRFPKIKTQRVKDSDFREDWRIKNDLFRNKWIKQPKQPYMRIAATATIQNDNDIKWDITSKRDQSAQTQKEIPTEEGKKLIFEIADRYITQDNNSQKYMLPVFAYYDTERAVVAQPQRRRAFKKEYWRYDAYLGALDGHLSFKRFFEWFVFQEDKQRREKEQLKSFSYSTVEMRTIQLAVERMLPGFSNLHTETNPLRLMVDWKKEEQFRSLRIDEQLSDGYKIVLVLVLDIVSRIIEANSEMTDNEEELLKTQGVVLIDEVDLHLHPAWQQRVIPDLQRTFPQMQFIVTTHSPQVVSSVPSECIRVIDNKKGCSVSGTEGAEASRILKEVFETEPRPEDNNVTKLLNSYLNDVYADKWNEQEVINKRNELNKKFAGHEPKLVEADLYIENRKWELEDEKTSK